MGYEEADAWQEEAENALFSAVEYARDLIKSHATAALVFAATSTELTWKSSILVPLVYGAVHIEALAQDIVARAVPRSGGLQQLYSFLSKVLDVTAAIDFTTHTRANSKVLLRDEINLIIDSRNKVLHQGQGCDLAMASLSIEVADSYAPRPFPEAVDIHWIAIRWDVPYSRQRNPNAVSRQTKIGSNVSFEVGLESGISSYVRPCRILPVMSLRTPPHCLKKNATSAFLH